MDDPEDLIPICITMLQYQQAKSAFDNAKDKEALKPWQGSKLMSLVTRNTFDLKKARMAERANRA